MSRTATLFVARLKKAGFFLLFLCLAATAFPQPTDPMVARGTPYFTLISDAIAEDWPSIPYPSYVPALIEKESLWRPRAELKTAREYGFGFGQFTIAKRADGTIRFNAFEEIKSQHAKLRNWSYEDRFDTKMQTSAILLKSKGLYRNCERLMQGTFNSMACVAASYNGGYGGFTSDRRVCGNTKGCNPEIWFGNVENTSLKQRTTVAGYGNSFFDINRLYVKDLMVTKRQKYIPYFEGDAICDWLASKEALPVCN